MAWEYPPHTLQLLLYGRDALSGQNPLAEVSWAGGRQGRSPGIDPVPASPEVGVDAG